MKLLNTIRELRLMREAARYGRHSVRRGSWTPTPGATSSTTPV